MARHVISQIIDDFRKGRIINYWFNILGYEVEVRALPLGYKADLKRLSNLHDDCHRGEGSWKELDAAIEDAYRKYGCDEDVVRLSSLSKFMRGD